MSILIKGMEMPKEGQVIVIDSSGQVWSNEWPTRGYLRIDNATAIPVPPHGDLIDRDEVRGLLFIGEQCLYSWDEIDDKVDAATTIIPAEEDKP